MKTPGLDKRQISNFNIELMVNDSKVENKSLAPPESSPRKSSVSANKEWTRNNMYESCCCDGRTDRRLLEYLVKIFITTVVLMFCIVNLMIHPNIEEKTTYYTIITTIIGMYLPQPKIKKEFD